MTLKFLKIQKNSYQHIIFVELHYLHHNSAKSYFILKILVGLRNLTASIILKFLKIHESFHINI